MSQPALLVCATELSGDVRGGRLAIEIRRLAPRLRLYGLGGERMRRAGVDVRMDITDRGTVGWFDHWRDLPCYLSALGLWRRAIRDGPPLAAIVIDAPGLSFPFARVARSAGIPVVYFVTPQTWLWNPRGAVERLRAHADIVVPTLEAEAAIYERASLPVIFEGHPALDDLIDTYGAAPREPEPPALRRGPESASCRGFGEPGGAPPFRLALVPGSRRHAIPRLLPIMLDAVDLVQRSVAVGEVQVSVAAPPLRSAVEACLRGRTRHLRVVEGDLRAVLKASDVVLASTGSNLLDAVFADVPCVAAYRVDVLTSLVARYGLRLQARLAAYTLPNLIAGEKVVPELIQQDVTARRLADAAVRLLTDEAAHNALLAGYRKVRTSLGVPGVNARIAGRLLKQLGIVPGAR